MVVDGGPLRISGILRERNNMAKCPVKGAPDSCGHPREGVPKGQCPNQTEPLTCRVPSQGAPSICNHPMVTQPVGVQGKSPSAWCHLPGLLGQNVMAQELRALTPSPEAMGPDGGCQNRNYGMSPPAPVSSDRCGHQPNQLPCCRDGLSGQTRPRSEQNTRCHNPRIQADL